MVDSTRLLSGHVPDSVFREFGHARLDAEAALRLRRVTTEEAIEAVWGRCAARRCWPRATRVRASRQE